MRMGRRHLSDVIDLKYGASVGDSDNVNTKVTDEILPKY